MSFSSVANPSEYKEVDWITPTLALGSEYVSELSELDLEPWLPVEFEEDKEYIRERERELEFIVETFAAFAPFRLKSNIIF